MSDTTAVSVTGRFSPLQIFLFLSQLVVEVDGQSSSGKWNEPIVVQVAPGRRRVTAYFRYPIMKRPGEASIDLDVPAGQTVELVYRAPVFLTSPGSLTNYFDLKKSNQKPL